MIYLVKIINVNNLIENVPIQIIFVLAMIIVTL